MLTLQSWGQHIPTGDDNRILSKSCVSKFACNRWFHLAVSITEPQSVQGVCESVVTDVSSRVGGHVYWHLFGFQATYSLPGAVQFNGTKMFPQ